MQLTERGSVLQNYYDIADSAGHLATMARKRVVEPPEAKYVIRI